ncbi:MAG TPA: flap endonuclease, partial [Nakamurella sp.]|nr:flap endonuclease [Nakamurella sp.]
MLQLLDLAGIYFRAFFAVPMSTTSPDGRPVNAVRGSLDILAKVISDARPTRVMACLDLDWRPAWRVALIPSYKTHR